MATRNKTPQVFCILRRYLSNTSNNRQSCPSISNIIKKKPKEEIVQVQGWVKSIRKMKSIIFLDVNDGSSHKSIQIASPAAKKPIDLQIGSSIKTVGKLQTTPKGEPEIFSEEIQILGSCDSLSYPLTPKQVRSPDYYRQILHLRPKTGHFSALLRIRNQATLAVHRFFEKNEFIGIHTPVLTGNDCEGAGEVFTVQPLSPALAGDSAKTSFFNGKAYLTVSGQLHLESAVRSLSKVYSFNPIFRAENSKSRLHLSEFYMIEAEQAFVEDLNNILGTIENFIKSITATIVSKCAEDIEIVTKYEGSDGHLKRIEEIMSKPFKTMSFVEAEQIIEEHSDKLKTIPKEGLTKEQELFLVEHNGGIPVFVVDWPKSRKPFYMKATTYDSSMVSAVDLLVSNTGELCGGSLREDSLDIVQKNLSAMGAEKQMAWYLDLRRYGNVPTGGFGMGFERYLQFLLNIGNIKDTIPFPRWPHSLQM